MVLVTQIDTFYNGLTLSHRDTINAAAGGTFMQKTPEECYELIENMTAHHNHWDTSGIRDETSRNISSTSTTETIGGYTQETAYATTGNYNSGGNSYQPQGTCLLPSNTISNPREDLKVITTRSGVTLVWGNLVQIFIKKDKIEAKRTKLGTGMKRARKIEAEGELISKLILIFCPKVEMSRDVLTVGSTMRIPLLYQREYSQWVERFMNYLEEQTDGEAMINSIKKGDQPLPRVTQVSIAGTTSTEQPPLKDKSMWSDQEKRVQKIDRL
nr:reverse transcriptase domain-containing protein [Tanacetum cinerariifolium]